MRVNAILFGFLVLLNMNFPVVQADNPDGAASSDSFRDKVVLKTGGELRGTIESEMKGDDGRKYLVFRSESGGLLKLDVSKLVRQSEKYDSVDDLYQRKWELAQETPEQLWDLYQWCQDQPTGGYRFRYELKAILQRITQLEPQDQKARRLLGYTQVDGKWILKSQLFAASGYEKNGTSWASRLQHVADRPSEVRRQEEGKRKAALSQWLRDLRKSSRPNADLQKKLNSFCDEIGLPIVLNQAAKNEKDPQVRRMFVEAFGRVAGFEANRALCYFSVEDPSVDIRERAITLLAQPHYSRQKSARLLSGYFRHADNESIQRAAFALGELKATSTLMPLIDALNTKHTVAITGNEPGRTKVAFGNGGTGLQTGGGPQSRDVVAKNDQVLVALRKITDQDFGYNEVTWKNWYLENFTLSDIQVRADD